MCVLANLEYLSILFCAVFCYYYYYLLFIIIIIFELGKYVPEGV